MADEIRVPDDLTPVEADDLRSLEQQLADRFNALYEDMTGEGADPTAEQAADLERLAGQVEQVRAEIAGREHAQQETAERIAQLHQRVHGEPAASDDPPDDDADDGAEDEPVGDDAAPAPVDAVAVAASAAAAATEQAMRLLADRFGPPGDRHAPALIGRRASGDDDADRVPDAHLPVTAGADIPGVPRGGEVGNLRDLTTLVQRRAASMPVTHTPVPLGVPIEYTMFPSAIAATVDNDGRFEHVVDNRTSPQQVDEIVKAMRSRDRQDAVLAGGGWCAPPEPRYTFFEISCQDGMVDLPTIGVRRGGIQYPVSPSMADVFTGSFSHTTNPWLWTDEDDILTVSGAVNKPCVRIPCADSVTVQLECYGVCATAGNLADDAWPEATENYLGLLTSAHERAMNMRYLQSMLLLADSPCVSGGGYDDAGVGAAAPLLGGVELAVIDYRYRYGMCDSDVLELVLPSWVRGVLRSDLAKRAGVDLLSVSDARLEQFFRDRGVRPQFVRDWQAWGTGLPGGEAPLSAWPSSVQYLLYAAGTYVLGNGMSLDLGIVRDSTLNAENDHTAAWFEECHLIAKIGHAARCYTQVLCPDGTTGAHDLTACGL